jgi:ankyrin repeat protein
LVEVFRFNFGYKVVDDPASMIEKLTILLDKLLEHGLDINAACEAGNSALIEALEFKVLQKETVKLLIDRAADIYHVVSGVWDALLHATVYGNAETIRCILKRAAKRPRADHWIKIEKWSPTEIQDDLDYICACLERYQLIETEYICHGTLLQMATSQGNLELTSRLLQHGANINVRDSSGWSVLHSATYDGHLEIVNVLLKYGAEVNCTASEWQRIWPFKFPRERTWKGQPIHLAAMSRHYEIAKLLLAHGVDIDAKVAYHENAHPTPGPTPLRLVLDTSDWYDNKRETLGPDLLKMAQLFLVHGADVRGAANKLKLEDVVRFEVFEDLWDTLRAGITED